MQIKIRFIATKIKAEMQAKKNMKLINFYSVGSCWDKIFNSKLNDEIFLFADFARKIKWIEEYFYQGITRFKLTIL